MRLWSLDPGYLDSKGLVALWREGLLAQAVLQGKTRGYRNHPQLERFRASSSPQEAIAAYLRGVHANSVLRGYRFAKAKIPNLDFDGKLNVTRGQLDYEWRHLRNKLEVRDADLCRALQDIERPLPHPLFRVVPGEIERWEKTGESA